MALPTRPDISGAGSPFDPIKHEDEVGTFWSARELMAPLDYDRWERFEDCIQRAMIAINSAGHSAPDHIRGAAKMVDVGSGARREVRDYRLTRFGAYMVAMNGDIRKHAVAEAQTYFAARTHQAEVAEALAKFEIPSDFGSALRLAAEKHDALVAAERHVAELEGPAAQAEVFRAAEGLRAVPDIANDFKVFAASRFPGVKVRHQDVWDHAGRLGIVIRGNTIRHNQPTADAIDSGWAHPKRHIYGTNTRGDQTAVTTRLTPRGEARLWDGLVAYIHQYGSLELPGQVAG